FLRYNQTLPSHLRDGRGYFRDWMIVTPVGLAANVAAFDLQYWLHAREMQDLRRRVDARHEKPSPQESRELALHRRQMAAAESRIAGALAAWKLYEFMYPEFAVEPTSAQSASELRKSYRTFIGAMRFDLYAEQFSRQVEAVLRQLDA